MPTEMRSLLEIIAVVITGAIFYFIGRNQSRLEETIKKLQEREEKAAIVQHDTRFITSNFPDNDRDVGITTPKSPLRIEFEQEQALRTLNDSYNVRPE